jgi:hypothetical protein
MSYSLAKSLVAAGVFMLSTVSLASTGLVIHSTEFGVGKFHRADNAVHLYDHASAWAPYVLPNGATTDKPLVQKNSDGSYTVFFSTLDDLMASVIQLSDSTNRKVSVLNVHGHGLLGAMWFPKDAATLSDWTCSDWVTAATGSDQDNYSQYYSAISVEDVQQIRDMSNNPAIQTGCTTGLPEWTAAVAKTPHFKDVFESDAQVHFLSCVVGLGSVGQTFTQGMAALLLPQGTGRVEASMDFGLGDWSMPEGMGFWDDQTDAQVDHDNSVYVVDHKDAEIAQKGTIRMASFSGSAWSTTLLANRDYMSLAFENSILGTVVQEPAFEFPRMPVPMTIRIPGTEARVVVKSR